MHWIHIFWASTRCGSSQAGIFALCCKLCAVIFWQRTFSNCPPERKIVRYSMKSEKNIDHLKTCVCLCRNCSLFGKKGRSLHGVLKCIKLWQLMFDLQDCPTTSLLLYINSFQCHDQSVNTLPNSLLVKVLHSTKKLRKFLHSELLIGSTRKQMELAGK